MSETEWDLDLAFDTDEPEFARGFEAAMLYCMVHTFKSGVNPHGEECSCPEGELWEIIHTENSEMALRIADYFEVNVRSVDAQQEGWLFLVITRGDSDVSS